MGWLLFAAWLCAGTGKPFAELLFVAGGQVGNDLGDQLRKANARSSPMKTVLFLCTGNYYRSRYAEILFNWKAQECGVAWKADSRGLDPDPRNPGPMSRHTMTALKRLDIP